jgi:charged multivesicular body protein 4
LDDELAELEQEQLDNKMLKTGTVPVSDEIHRLPTAANGESKLRKLICLVDY